MKKIQELSFLDIKGGAKSLLDFTMTDQIAYEVCLRKFEENFFKNGYNSDEAAEEVYFIIAQNNIFDSEEDFKNIMHLRMHGN